MDQEVDLPRSDLGGIVVDQEVDLPRSDLGGSRGPGG